MLLVYRDHRKKNQKDRNRFLNIFHDHIAKEQHARSVKRHTIRLLDEALSDNVNPISFACSYRKCHKTAATH